MIIPIYRIPNRYPIYRIDMPIDIPMMSDLPYRSPISISHGIPRLGVAAVDTSYAIVRASFSPNHHSKERFLGLRRPKSLAQSAHDFRS